MYVFYHAMLHKEGEKHQISILV